MQHVLNRGNGRMKLFHKPQDYQSFVDLLGEALDHVPGMRLLAWCLMPNHWHRRRRGLGAVWRFNQPQRAVPL